jgi:hypothetical protein
MSATRQLSPRRWLTARCNASGGTRMGQPSQIKVSSRDAAIGPKSQGVGKSTVALGLPIHSSRAARKARPSSR